MKNKKILSFLLAMVFIVPCAFVLSACGPSKFKSTQYTADIVTMFSRVGRNVEYENLQENKLKEKAFSKEFFNKLNELKTKPATADETIMQITNTLEDAKDIKEMIYSQFVSMFNIVLTTNSLLKEEENISGVTYKLTTTSDNSVLYIKSEKIKNHYYTYVKGENFTYYYDVYVGKKDAYLKIYITYETEFICFYADSEYNLFNYTISDFTGMEFIHDKFIKITGAAGEELASLHALISEEINDKKEKCYALMEEKEIKELTKENKNTPADIIEIFPELDFA